MRSEDLMRDARELAGRMTYYMPFLEANTELVATFLAAAERRGLESAAVIAEQTVNRPPYTHSNSEYSAGYTDAGEEIAEAVRKAKEDLA